MRLEYPQTMIDTNTTMLGHSLLLLLLQENSNMREFMFVLLSVSPWAHSANECVLGLSIKHFLGHQSVVIKLL